MQESSEILQNWREGGNESTDDQRLAHAYEPECANNEVWLHEGLRAAYVTCHSCCC